MATASASAEEMAKFGRYLTSEYEILRRVFSYLPCSDVRSCGQVNEAWKKVSVLTMNERKEIQCFWSNEKTTLCPDLTDAFLTLSFSTVKKAKNEAEDQAIASKEVLNFLSRYGVIAIINDAPPQFRRHRVELPLTPRTYIHTGVRFPDWNNVTMKTVTVTKGMSPEDFMGAIDLPDNVPIKAVIFIVYDNDDDYFNLGVYFKVIQNRDRDCAMGGCKLDWAEEDEDVSDFKCVIFAGDNVQAASCVLDNQCRTLKDINARVEEFSKGIVPFRNSVILAFRCCDRQKVRRRYKYEPKQNVEAWETNALKTFLPLVPVVGCYGVGEFGVNSPQVLTAKRPRLYDTEDIEYAFSTIIVYIGFK